MTLIRHPGHFHGGVVAIVYAAPGVGHVPFGEAPDRFREEVLRFLSA